MKRILSTLLCVLMLLAIGCETKSNEISDDPNLGVYKATTMEYLGVTIDIAEFFEQGFTIELKPNGKCVLTVDSDSSSGKWSLDGSSFTVQGGGLDCTGTLENGCIRLQYDADVVITLINESYPLPRQTEAPVTKTADPPALQESDATPLPDASDSGQLIGNAILLNYMDVAITELYISDDPDEWGECLLKADETIAANTGARIDFFPIWFDAIGGSAGVYDIGLYDAEKWNYDFFDVKIDFGDFLMVMPPQDGKAVLLVVHGDGTFHLYSGDYYKAETQSDVA